MDAPLVHRVARSVVGIAAVWLMVSHAAEAHADSVAPPEVDANADRAPTPVLPPEAATVLSAAFDKIAPAWVADPVALNRDQVRATLCPAGTPSACVHLTLDPPRVPCPGTTLGPFCALFPDGPPPTPLLDALRTHLGPLPASRIWFTPPVRTPPGVAVVGRPVPPDVWPKAVALVVSPWIVGLIVGWVLRRLRGQRATSIGAALAWVGIPVVALTLPLQWAPIMGLWDVWQVAGMFALGGLFTQHAWFAPRFSVPVFVGTTAVSLALVEVVVRAAVGPAPAVDRRSPPALWLPQTIEEMPDLQLTQWSEREQVCKMLYPDFVGLLDLDRLHTEVVLPAKFTPKPVPRHVLHVGDSMVYGMALDRTQTFAAVLNTLEPDTQHIDAGIIGAGPDDYVAMVDVWTRKTPVDHVYVYLFEGNDLYDTNAPHPCTGGGSLVDHQPDGAVLRPHTKLLGQRNAGLERLARLSPPPFVVRVAQRQWLTGGWIGQLMTGWQQGDGMSARFDSLDEERAFLRSDLQAIGKILAARKIAWSIVILPAIEHVNQAVAKRPIASMQADLAALLHVPVLDAAPTLAAVEARGEWPFLSKQDFHMNALGHRALAAWLHQK